MRELEALFERVVARHDRDNRVWGRLTRRFKRDEAPERGLYFWGGVGRGKTYLMDAFWRSSRAKRTPSTCSGSAWRGRRK